MGPDSKSVDKKRKAVVAAVAAENDEIKIFMEREMVVAQWKKVPTITSTIAQLWLRKAMVIMAGWQPGGPVCVASACAAR